VLDDVVGDHAKDDENNRLEGERTVKNENPCKKSKD
jgi:hypothetical protein